MPTYTYEEAQKVKEIKESLNAIKYEIVPYREKYYVRKKRKRNS